MDVRAHHLSRVDYEASGFTQTYTGYDVPLDVQIPQHSITAAELQKRLQAL